MSEPESFDDLLAEAQLPRRLVSICLRGDLTAKAQQLNEALEAAQTSSGPKRLSDGGRDEELAAELEALRELMIAKSTDFIVEACSSADWRGMKARHPLPSQPSPTDNVIGAEATPFFNEAVRKAIVEPVLDDAKWERLTTVLSEGEWSKLVEAVYALNEEPVSIPFSLLSSEILRSLSSDSELPETPE